MATYRYGILDPKCDWVGCKKKATHFIIDNSYIFNYACKKHKPNKLWEPIEEILPYVLKREN